MTTRSYFPCCDLSGGSLKSKKTKPGSEAHCMSYSKSDDVCRNVGGTVKYRDGVDRKAIVQGLDARDDMSSATLQTALLKTSIECPENQY